MKTSFMSLVLMSAFSLGSVAQAEVFNCNFTEPFIVVKADTKAEQMTIFEISQQEKTVNTKSEITDGKNGILKISDLDGGTALVINLQEKGNDGMSDRIYDVDASLIIGGVLRVRGGCDTQK